MGIFSQEMGWFVKKDSNQREWYGHSGGSVGGISIMKFYPKEDIVIVILSISSNVQYGELTDRIVSKLLE